MTYYQLKTIIDFCTKFGNLNKFQRKKSFCYHYCLSSSNHFGLFYKCYNIATEARNDTCMSAQIALTSSSLPLLFDLSGLEDFPCFGRLDFFCPFSFGFLTLSKGCISESTKSKVSLLLVYWIIFFILLKIPLAWINSNIRDFTNFSVYSEIHKNVSFNIVEIFRP